MSGSRLVHPTLIGIKRYNNKKKKEEEHVRIPIDRQLAPRGKKSALKKGT
jgi:hypothetical protein